MNINDECNVMMNILMSDMNISTVITIEWLYQYVTELIASSR